MRNPYVAGAVLFLAVVLLISVLLPLFHKAGRGIAKRRAAARARRDATGTPWAHYSRPDLDGDAQFWVVGVERVTEDGRVLNRVEINRMSHDNLTARYDAEAQAISRAVEYNAAKAGM